MIFARNVPSVGRISKKSKVYFERGPEIQKVVNTIVNYSRFVKVGAKGPRHEWLARSDFNGIQMV